MAIPRRIPVRREAGYHTDQIGRYGRGAGRGQFMAFVIASLPPLGQCPDDWERHKRWYALLHLFDAAGAHRETWYWFCGTTADGQRRAVERAEAILAAWLDELAEPGPLRYGDVKVELFELEVDGRTFGLVDASEPDDNYERVDLLPNDLAFFPPWDGAYDT